MAEAEAKHLIDEIRWVQGARQSRRIAMGSILPLRRIPNGAYPVGEELKTDSDTVRHLDRKVRLTKRRGNSTPSVEFDLPISLPPGVHVAIENAVGPINGQSVFSPLELSTRHGVIQLDDVRSPINARSEFGDVLLAGLNADAIVNTLSGSIELSRITSGKVALSTRSGNCRIVQRAEDDFKIRLFRRSPDRRDRRERGAGFRPEAMVGTRNCSLAGQSGPSITINSGNGQTVIESGP